MALFIKPGRFVPCALCLAAIAASTSVFAAGSVSEPLAPEARVTTLTKPGFFTEPGIAISQMDPDRITAIYQDNVHVAFSKDAGAHWTDEPNVAPPEWRVSGDVSVTYDGKGHAIASYMAFNRLGTEGYWAHDASPGGLFVRRSLDGGKTCANNTVIDVGTAIFH